MDMVIDLFIIRKLYMLSADRFLRIDQLYQLIGFQLFGLFQSKSGCIKSFLDQLDSSGSKIESCACFTIGSWRLVFTETKHADNGNVVLHNKNSPFISSS